MTDILIGNGAVVTLGTQNELIEKGAEGMKMVEEVVKRS